MYCDVLHFLQSCDSHWGMYNTRVCHIRGLYIHEPLTLFVIPLNGERVTHTHSVMFHSGRCFHCSYTSHTDGVVCTVVHYVVWMVELRCFSVCTSVRTVSIVCCGNHCLPFHQSVPSLIITRYSTSSNGSHLSCEILDGIHLSL